MLLLTAAALSFSCVSLPDNDPGTDPGGEDPGEAPILSLSVERITSSAALISVTPCDDSFRYFFDLVKRSDYDAWGGDANTIAQNVEYIEQAIEIMEIMGYSATWDDFTNVGPFSETYTGLVPSTEYVLFAFGLDSEGNPTSELVRQAFTTEPFVPEDDCAFKISFSDVTTTSMNVDIKPSNPSTRYYVGLCNASSLETYSPDELALQFIDSENDLGTDWADTEFVHTGEQSLNTTSDLMYDPLTGSTEYAAVVFGVDLEGARTTNVAVARQRTADPEQSQMTFSILVNSVTVNGAKAVFIPSTDDETYFTDVMDYETFSKFSSDEELTAYILNQAGSSITAYLTSGQHTVDCSNMLVADTRYVAYCFGYDNGVTTGVFSEEFTTEKLVTGSDAAVAVNYVVEDGSWYGYPGYGVVTISMVPKTSADDWYAAVFKSLDGVDDGVLTQALMADGYKNRQQLAFYADWDSTAHFAVVAVDHDGVAGAPSRCDIPVSLESATSVPMSLKAHDIRSPASFRDNADLCYL